MISQSTPKSEPIATLPAWSTSVLFWLGLGLVVLVGIGLQSRLLNSFPLNPDEGIHLLWLRMLSAGYQPYSQVYITYPPLYPLTIFTVWEVWPTEAAQRWLSLGFTAFGVVGIALVARRFAGPAAGVIAAGLALASSPLIEHSRAVMGEFHAVAWSVWAIWLAWGYLEAETIRPRRLLLSLSALTLAASLLTKLLLPFVAPLIGLIIITRWWPENSSARDVISRWQNSRPALMARLKPLLADLLLWGLVLLLPILLLFVVNDLGSLVQQVIGQRLDARDAYTSSDGFWTLRGKFGLQFWQSNPGLILTTLLGVGIAWGQRRRRLWLMMSWLGLAFLMLAVHNPIRYKHFLILTPLFAIFGAVTVTYWLDQLYAAWQQGIRGWRPARARRVAIFGTLMVLGLGFWQATAVLALKQAAQPGNVPPVDEVEALAFIEAITAPQDCLITDDMPLAYWSNRPVPPELAEVSSNRLVSGLLTTEQLVSLTDQYDCQVVAAVSNRIPKHLPDYMAWVKGEYLGMFHYAEDDIFFAKRHTDPVPASPLWAKFGADFDDQIIFHGSSLSAATVKPGERIALSLVWEAQSAIDTDYAIFVQVRDAAGATVISADHSPYLGLLPTSRWPAEAVVQETTWLEVPADLPPGDYPIYIGLYRLDTLERLPLRDDTSGEQALIVGPLVVE